MIVFENKASLRREDCIAPPQNLQHWEVAKTTKQERMVLDNLILLINKPSGLRFQKCALQNVFWSKSWSSFNGSFIEITLSIFLPFPSANFSRMSNQSFFLLPHCVQTEVLANYYKSAQCLCRSNTGIPISPCEVVCSCDGPGLSSFHSKGY